MGIDLIQREMIQPYVISTVFYPPDVSKGMGLFETMIIGLPLNANGNILNGFRKITWDIHAALSAHSDAVLLAKYILKIGLDDDG